MKYRLRYLILLFLMDYCLCSQAQRPDIDQGLYSTLTSRYLRLCGSPEKRALYFDLDRLWNYNRYEHSRWGGGLRFDYRTNLPYLRMLSLDAYIGYGIHDQTWKWGTSLDINHGGSHQLHTFISLYSDLDVAAPRSMEHCGWSDFSGNVNLISDRFYRLRGLTLGWKSYWWQHLSFTTEFSANAATPLFGSLYFDDGFGIPIPSTRMIYSDGFPDPFQFFEVRLRFDHTFGFRAELIQGTVPSWQTHYTRLLAQYEHTFSLNHFNLNLFSQAGVAISKGEFRTPYFRTFDLGGSMGCAYYFRHTLLTTYPHEFLADQFLFASARLSTKRPLFDLFNDLFRIGTRPRPFAQLSVLWGDNLFNDPSGDLAEYLIDDEYAHGFVPRYGLLEPTLGIDGLLRWGVTEWGIGISYRLAPHIATYRRQGLSNNLALLFTATVTL